MKGYARRAACGEGATMTIIISPSILSADFARLGEEVECGARRRRRLDPFRRDG